MKANRFSLVFNLIILLCLSVSSLDSQEFEDVAVERGVNLTFGTGNLGGGLSFADFNNDYWDDLTVATQDGDSLAFFINDEGRFRKIAPLVPLTCAAKSVIWVDTDNDGDKDFYVSCHWGQNRYYENIGSLELVDRTLSSGLQQVSDPSMGASFGDFNGDGLLDLYTTNYYDDIYHNRLYINEGNHQFSDQTVVSGLHRTGANYSFQSSLTDINNDLLPDIYVAIDKDYINRLYKNHGDGTFEDISETSNANVVVCAMNAGGGDYDGDGDIDLYVTNSPSGNILLRNNGDDTFTDVTDQAGVGFFRIGWATSFFDSENDGDLDMYVSAMSNVDPNALYINQGDGSFTEPLRFLGGIGGNDTFISLTNIQGDFNNDGLVDIAVSNEARDPINVWQNNNRQNPGNWLKLSLKGNVSNSDGYGAWVHGYIENKQISRLSLCGEGYLGQNSNYLHLGLGEESSLDSLVILWPSGIVDKYFNMTTNQLIEVEEGSSNVNSDPCPIIRILSSEMSANESRTIRASHLIRSEVNHQGAFNTNYTAGVSVNLEKAFEVALNHVLEVVHEGCEE